MSNEILYPNEFVGEVNEVKASFLKFVDKINAQKDARKEFYDMTEKFNSICYGKWFPIHNALVDKDITELEHQILSSIEACG